MELAAKMQALRTPRHLEAEEALGTPASLQVSSSSYVPRLPLSARRGDEKSILSRPLPHVPHLPLSGRRAPAMDDPDLPRAMKFVESARQRPPGYLPRIHQARLSDRKRAADAEELTARAQSRIGALPGPGRRSDVLGQMGHLGRNVPAADVLATVTPLEDGDGARALMAAWGGKGTGEYDRTHLDSLWNNRILPVLLPNEKRDIDMMVFALEQVLSLTPFSVARAHGELDEAERAEAYRNADELFRWTFHELYKRVPMLQQALLNRCTKCKSNKETATAAKGRLKDVQAAVEAERQRVSELQDEVRRLQELLAQAQAHGAAAAGAEARGKFAGAAMAAERAKAEKMMALQGALQSAIDGGYAQRHALRAMDSSELKAVLRQRGEMEVPEDGSTQTDRCPPLGELPDPAVDSEGRKLLYDEFGNAYYGVNHRGDKILAYDGERTIMGWDEKGRPVYDQGSLGRDANGYDIIAVDDEGRNILAFITGPDGTQIAVYGYDPESGRAIIGFDKDGNPIYEDDGGVKMHVAQNVKLRMRSKVLSTNARQNAKDRRAENLMERLGASGLDAQGRLVDKDGNPLDLSKLSHEDLLLVSLAMQSEMAKTAAQTEWFRAGEKHGVVSVKHGKYAVMESNEVVSIGIERLRGSQGEITVRCVAEDHTAKNGMDFDFPGADITWMDGEFGEKQVDIPVMNSESPEGNRVFYFVMQSVTGGAVLSLDLHSCMVVVIDDDGSVLDFQLAVQGGSVNVEDMLNKRKATLSNEAKLKKKRDKQQKLLKPGDVGYLPASWLKFLGVGSIAELKSKGTKTMSPKMMHAALYQISHALLLTLPLKDKAERCYSNMVGHVVEFARQSYGIKVIAVDKLGTLVRTLNWAGELGVDQLAIDFMTFCGIRPGVPQTPEADVLVYLDVLQLMSENCEFKKRDPVRFWGALEKGEVVSVSSVDLLAIIHGIFPHGGWDEGASKAVPLANEDQQDVKSLQLNVPTVLHGMLVAFQETRPQRLAAAEGALGGAGASSAITFHEFMERSAEITCYSNREVLEEAFALAAKTPHPRHANQMSATAGGEDEHSGADDDDDGGGGGRERPQMHYRDVDPAELQGMDAKWTASMHDAATSLVDRVPCLVGSSRFTARPHFKAAAKAHLAGQPHPAGG